MLAYAGKKPISMNWLRNRWDSLHGQTLVCKFGRLVYATCSLLEEENEAQASAFLLRHPDFTIVPLGPPHGL